MNILWFCLSSTEILCTGLTELQASWNLSYVDSSQEQEGFKHMKSLRAQLSVIVVIVRQTRLLVKWVAWVRRLRPVCLGRSGVYRGFVLSCCAKSPYGSVPWNKCYCSLTREVFTPCSPSWTEPSPPCDSKTLTVWKITARLPSFSLSLMAVCLISLEFGMWSLVPEEMHDSLASAGQDFI